MTKAERELWHRYFETLAQKKQLEDFLKTLKKPDERQKEVLQSYDEIVAGVKAKIFSLFSASFLMKKSVEEIQQRLDSTEYKNNIALVTHQILQANNHARKMLKQASSELDKAVDDLSNALFSQTVEEPQISFKTRQVYDLIRRQFFGLKKEYENTLDKKFSLQRQIISPQRATLQWLKIFLCTETSNDCANQSAAIKKTSIDSPKILLPSLKAKKYSKVATGQRRLVPLSCRKLPI